MKKTCPRCNSVFECRSNQVPECDCTKVSLSAEASQYIRDNYPDCLCLKCLKQIAGERLQDNGLIFPD
jgi:hypothetical protein